MIGGSDTPLTHGPTWSISPHLLRGALSGEEGLHPFLLQCEPRPAAQGSCSPYTCGTGSWSSSSSTHGREEAEQVEQQANDQCPRDRHRGASILSQRQTMTLLVRPIRTASIARPT